MVICGDIMKIQDIAKLANVSVATVSRVINNNDNVREETRKKINKIIKENNYYPNLIARNLSKNENNTIGVILPDIKNLYFASIMNEIVNEANIKGLNIIVGCSNESFRMQKKYIELFLEQRVKGIIIAVTQ
ncbi:MAG: LacI family DNA-binding transcriptional regulator, partial [Leptotrichiaceae bacterium]|nr:LacI family DNA-binding transcriptional regulator [Leptotrichiaceae bacterium]